MKIKMLSSLTLSFLLLALCFTGVRIYKSYNFNLEIGGHLKRAANANTVELAKKELKVSLDEMKERRLTQGNTGVLLKTPSKDVEFWYSNIEASYNELNEVKEDASQLERTNLLMKLRETLTDDDGVIVPVGISVFPNNTLYLLWGWISWGGVAAMGIRLLAVLNRKYRIF